MENFGDILLKHIHKLEMCLPYGDIIAQCLSTGIVTTYEYHDLEAVSNEIKRNRDTVLKIAVKPPKIIEEFCYLLQSVAVSKELGTRLLKECQLQKHHLIEQLQRELAEAKKTISEGTKAAPAVNGDVVSTKEHVIKDTNDKRVTELEENCARLRRQLKMKQMEAQRWKDTCLQLEKQLKELQAALSPSPSRRFFRREDSLLLGTGKYGIVHRVHHDDKWHAGKTIHKSLYVDGSANQTRVTLVCNKFVKLDHSNIEVFVAVEQSCTENIPMLLTEYFPENLDEFVSRRKTNLAFCEQLSLVTNMSDGLSYLHQNDITHGNLHGRNVLIDYQHQAKIGDFICPQLYRAGIIHNATDSSDTQAFIAPELSEDKAINSMESDVYALGVLFLQVFVQEIPTMDSSNLITKLDDCHPIQPLVYSCISEVKEVRPDCVEICDQLARSKDSPHSIIYNCLYGKKELPSLASSLQSGRGQMKWIRLNNLPQPMHSAYAVRLENNLYVAGGIGSDKEMELTVFEFDLFHGTWRHLPQPLHKSGIPHAVCGKLVLFGGFDVATNKITNQVSTYDKDNNVWTSFYPNLKECRCFPAVMSHANHVIVAGGKNREDILDDFEVMHTLECQWRKLSHRRLPKRTFNFSATISNHWLYLVRTVGSYPPSSSKQAYAIAMEDVIVQQDLDSVKTENDWTRLSDVPHMNVTIVPDSFPPLLVGGSDSQGNTVSDVLLYNAAERLWRQVGTLSSNRANVAVTTISNHAVIIIGGCTDSRTKDTCKSSAVNIVELGYMDESTI